MLKYQQIITDILYDIKQGILTQGAKLPSIRELKNRYFCSSETVLRALNELKYQHIIFSNPKSGFYVLSPSNYESTEDTDLIDFATAIPEKTMFPYTEFQHCLNQAIEVHHDGLFSYGMTVHGLDSLILEVKKLLEQYQVFTKNEDIVITTGTQQALYILTVMPFPNEGETIVVEQPSYHLFNRLLETTGTKYIGIKRDANGINLQQLEKIFSEHRVKFFYTMPRFHNPLGTSFCKKDKFNILALANKYNVYIVEDDYVADFDLNTKADPMFAYDVCNRVIYLKSFSKIIFPGLRVGVTVLPNLISKHFLALKRVVDYDTSLITQGALDLYLKSGMFHSHSRMLSKKYAEKSTILHEEVQKLANSSIIDYTRPNSLDTKLHIVLPPQINIETLIQHLLIKDVHIKAIDENYLINFHKENILKIDARNTNQSLIAQGVQKISTVVTEII